ncbi:hypothetical protein C8F01DRAFT_1168800 [Mycena amicta]|nr:hypothetical protein C8F01DRAFT_1168800 [Mycena amicta]
MFYHGSSRTHLKHQLSPGGGRRKSPRRAAPQVDRKSISSARAAQTPTPSTPTPAALARPKDARKEPGVMFLRWVFVRGVGVVGLGFGVDDLHLPITGIHHIRGWLGLHLRLGRGIVSTRRLDVLLPILRLPISISILLRLRVHDIGRRRPRTMMLSAMTMMMARRRMGACPGTQADLGNGVVWRDSDGMRAKWGPSSRCWWGHGAVGGGSGGLASRRVVTVGPRGRRRAAARRRPRARPRAALVLAVELVVAERGIRAGEERVFVLVGRMRRVVCPVGDAFLCALELSVALGRVVVFCHAASWLGSE